jgi:ABC-type uncharacterized transport system substrate-binding protein
MRLARATAIVLAAWAGLAAHAQAHPHVFVDVDVVLDVGEDGALRGMRHDWTFDDMYSAFAVQGLPRAGAAPTRDALARLAEEIVERLEDSDFFTKATAPDQELQPVGASHARAEFIDGRLRLSFSLRMRAIIGAPDTVQVRVFDPQYVVAMNVGDKVRIDGPARCRHTLIRPGALDPADARQLDDSTRTNQLAPDFGAKLATVIALDCRTKE